MLYVKRNLSFRKRLLNFLVITYSMIHALIIGWKSMVLYFLVLYGKRFDSSNRYLSSLSIQYHWNILATRNPCSILNNSCCKINQCKLEDCCESVKIGIYSWISYVRIGGEIRIIPSPRTKSMGDFFFMVYKEDGWIKTNAIQVHGAVHESVLRQLIR